MAEPTFKAAVSDYIAYIDQRLRPTTIRSYCGVAKWLVSVIGEDTSLGKVDISEVRERLERPTMNQTRSVLAGIYSHARKNGYSGPDPSQGLERGRKKHPAPIDVYTPAEIMKLADAASSLQDRAIFLCAGLAGLRLSELRGLMWKDIDFQNDVIHVRRGYTNESGFAPTKSGKERSVPMVAQLKAVLDPQSMRDLDDGWSGEDLVFSDNGEVIDGNCLYRRFLTASKHAGLRRLRFHDLRHSAISLMVQAFPLSDVMIYAGHSSLSTTLRYIHFTPRKDAAEKLGALVG